MCTTTIETSSNHENDLNIIMRPMYSELNLLTRSDGSALLAQGETSVMSSVNGPVEVKLQNLQIEKSSVEVFYRPKSGLPSVTDRLREQIIKNTCETAILVTLHPRTAISLQLQEMEDRGGLIACAVNAACLSLLNSGLSMRFLIAAVNCIIDKNGEIILDPDHRQSMDARANLTFVFESVLKNTVTIYTTGKFTQGQYNDSMILCREASNIVFDFYKDVVKKMAKVL